MKSRMFHVESECFGRLFQVCSNCKRLPFEGKCLSTYYLLGYQILTVVSDRRSRLLEEFFVNEKTSPKDWKKKKKKPDNEDPVPDSFPEMVTS